MHYTEFIKQAFITGNLPEIIREQTFFHYAGSELRCTKEFRMTENLKNLEEHVMMFSSDKQTVMCNCGVYLTPVENGTNIILILGVCKCFSIPITHKLIVDLCVITSVFLWPLWPPVLSFTSPESDLKSVHPYVGDKSFTAIITLLHIHERERPV